jgi:hypothetical protein
MNSPLGDEPPTDEGAPASSEQRTRPKSKLAYLRYKRKKLFKRLKQHRRKFLVLVLALVLVAAALAVNAILHLPREFKAYGASAEENAYVGAETNVSIKIKNLCWMPFYCPAFHNISIKSASSEQVTVVNSSEVASLGPGEEKTLNVNIMLKSPYEVKNALVAVSKENLDLVELTLTPVKRVRLEVARSSYILKSGTNTSMEFAIAANDTSSTGSSFTVELSADAEGILINGKDAFYGVTMEASVGAIVKVPVYAGVRGGNQSLVRLSLSKVQEDGRILFDEKKVTIVVT